jgi:hypothetical protein
MSLRGASREPRLARKNTPQDGFFDLQGFGYFENENGPERPFFACWAPRDHGGEGGGSCLQVPTAGEEGEAPSPRSRLERPKIVRVFRA